MGDATKIELMSSEKNFLTLIVYLVKNTDDFRQPKFLYPNLGTAGFEIVGRSITRSGTRLDLVVPLILGTPGLPAVSVI